MAFGPEPHQGVHLSLKSPVALLPSPSGGAKNPTDFTEKIKVSLSSK